jgi:hypothetical protein
MIALDRAHEHADPPHPLRLLRARHERPRGCRSAEKRDERAASHVFPLKPGLAAYQKCRVVHHSRFRWSMSQLGQDEKNSS